MIGKMLVEKGEPILHPRMNENFTPFPQMSQTCFLFLFFGHRDFLKSEYQNLLNGKGKNSFFKNVAYFPQASSPNQPQTPADGCFKDN